MLGSAARIISDRIIRDTLEASSRTIFSVGCTRSEIRTVSSHPMALAQCERFFAQYPQFKRTPAEDTAGSVRQMMDSDDKSHAAIASRRAVTHYHAAILAERIQDNAENFTRFVLL